MWTDWLGAGLNEVFSGFENIGHNDLVSLTFLWIIPKYVHAASYLSFEYCNVANGLHSGAWLILPSYMTYAFAVDILDGLAKASGDTSSKPARAATPIKNE